MSGILPVALFVVAVVAGWGSWSTALGGQVGGLQVGVTSETRRIMRHEEPPAGKVVQLFAARNEWESFQVLLRSAEPVKQLSIKVAELVGPNGNVIAAHNIRLYRQHQLHLTEPTYRNERFRPGWYPDALIPFRHPLTREPLNERPLRAVPFDLPANETHGFWVDVYVPKTVAGGIYEGSVAITVADKPVVHLPVRLTVWNFTLPDVPTFQTAFGSPSARMRSWYKERFGADQYAKIDWSAVDEQCAELLSRHRINASPPPGSIIPQEQPDGSFAIPLEQVQRLRQFVDRYHINALQIPHPRVVVSDPQKQFERLKNWLAAWDKACAELDRHWVTFYIYLKDEPNDPEAYEYVRRWGKAIRSTGTVVKVLVVEQTKPQDPEWGDLYGAVDIWCALFPLFDPEYAAKRQELGETIWAYTALCQGKQMTPWWHIDYPLLHYRAPAWICWRYGIRGLLYWGGMSYWRQVSDPWQDPKTYVVRSGNRTLVYNGEGSLLYPAEPLGFVGVVPSLRVKALRDSIEDYEYLAILERAGKRDVARKVVMTVASDWFTWEHSPQAYENARRQLAELILQLSEDRP